MSLKNDLIHKRHEVLKVAKKNGIKSVKLFGSVKREEEKSSSDIDFLVEFEYGRSLFDLIRFKREVEGMFNKPVDVVTINSVHPSLRDKIVDEAIPL